MNGTGVLFIADRRIADLRAETCRADHFLSVLQVFVLVFCKPHVHNKSAILFRIIRHLKRLLFLFFAMFIRDSFFVF